MTKCNCTTTGYHCNSKTYCFFAVDADWNSEDTNDVDFGTKHKSTPSALLRVTMDCMGIVTVRDNQLFVTSPNVCQTTTKHNSSQQSTRYTSTYPRHVCTCSICCVSRASIGFIIARLFVAIFNRFIMNITVTTPERNNREPVNHMSGSAHDSNDITLKTTATVQQQDTRVPSEAILATMFTCVSSSSEESSLLLSSSPCR